MAQNNNQNEPSFQSSNSPHFWWLMSILGMTIIVLIAFIMTDRILGAYKIMEYVSYASVILSITLSVFAILYTYTSNVQIQQQFEKINSAAAGITSTSDKLSETGKKLADNLDDILERLDSIRGSIDDLNAPANTQVPINNTTPPQQNG